MRVHAGIHDPDRLLGHHAVHDAERADLLGVAARGSRRAGSARPAQPAKEMSVRDGYASVAVCEW